MAKFYLNISSLGNTRITFGGIGEKYQGMTDGAVIADPSVLIDEIVRISNECNEIHELAEFFTVSEDNDEHSWMFYDAGQNGWARFFFEKTAGEMRQIGYPDMWATIKDLLWYIGLVSDYEYDRI